MPETVWFESRRYGWLFERGLIALLGFSRRDVADGLEQPAMVEPVDPGERGELDRLKAPPWPSPVT